MYYSIFPAHYLLSLSRQVFTLKNFMLLVGHPKHTQRAVSLILHTLQDDSVLVRQKAQKALTSLMHYGFLSDEDMKQLIEVGNIVLD